MTQHQLLGQEQLWKYSEPYIGKRSFETKREKRDKSLDIFKILEKGWQ